MEGWAGSGRDAVWALLDEADAVADRLAALSFYGLTPLEVLAVLARREVVAEAPNGSPPPHLDDGSPCVNEYHHREHLLLPEDDDSG